MDRDSQNIQDTKRRRKSAAQMPTKEEEENWQSSKSGDSQWMLFGALTIILIICGAAFGVMKMTKTEALGQQDVNAGASVFVPPPLVEEVEDAKVESQSWLNENSSEIPEMAVALVEAVMSEGDSIKKRDALRKPFESIKLMEKVPSLFEPKPILKRFDGWSLAIKSSGDREFAIFSGKCEDYTDFNYYFVEEGGVLKFDWQASAAYSEVKVSSLIENKPAAPVLVRAILRKPEIYVGPYDEDKWSSWELTDPTGGESLWAYVPKDSEINKELLSWLDYGRFIVELKKEERGRFKVKAPLPGAHKKQVEIVEILHRTWVNP